MYLTEDNGFQVIKQSQPGRGLTHTRLGLQNLFSYTENKQDITIKYVHEKHFYIIISNILRNTKTHSATLKPKQA